MEDKGNHINSSAIGTDLADSGVKASITFDTRGRILYFDVTSEEIFGSFEGTGYLRSIRDIYEYFSRTSRRIIRRAYGFAIKNPVCIMSRSSCLICMKGSSRSYTISLTPVVTSKNKIIAVTMYFEEVHVESDQAAPHMGSDIRFVLDKRLRNMINQFPAMIFYTAWGNDFCHMNSYACRALGYIPDSEPGGSWINLIHPDDRKRVLRDIQAALMEKRAIKQEYRIKRSNGLYAWLEMYSAPYYDMGDGLTGLLGVAFDITEQREAEGSLRRYELFSKNTRDIILFIDSEGRIMDANKAAENTYGYSYNELCSMTLNDISEEWKYAAVQAEHDNEAGIHYQTTHKCKDGSLINVEVSSQGADIGGRKLLLHIIRDITDRKRAERELLRSYYLYRSLFMNLSDGYALCRIISDSDDNIKDLKIIEVNERFTTDFSLSPKKVLNRGLSEVLPILQSDIIDYIRENRQELKNGLCKHKEGLFMPALGISLSISFYSPKENEIAMIVSANSERTEVIQKPCQEDGNLPEMDTDTDKLADIQLSINAGIKLRELELDLNLLEPAIKYSNSEVALSILKDVSETAKAIPLDNTMKYIKQMEQAVYNGNNQEAMEILQELEAYVRSMHT